MFIDCIRQATMSEGRPLRAHQVDPRRPAIEEPLPGTRSGVDLSRGRRSARRLIDRRAEAMSKIAIWSVRPRGIHSAGAEPQSWAGGAYPPRRPSTRAAYSNAQRRSTVPPGRRLATVKAAANRIKHQGGAEHGLMRTTARSVVLPRVESG